MNLEISPDGKDPWYPLYEGVTYQIDESFESRAGRMLSIKLPQVAGRAFFRQSFRIGKNLRSDLLEI